MKVKNYKPYNKKTDFIYFSNTGKINKLVNLKFKYCLSIKNNGYVPKTGIFLLEKLSKYDFNDMNVLDIGTGETGILAIHLAAMGAKNIIGIDIDRNAIKWARLNAKLNNFNNIKFKISDIKDYKPSDKLDIIISNPPQMPTEKISSIHDDGGLDGREYIDHIINFSFKYLKNGGLIFFTVFDFLNVEQSYNNNLSMMAYSKKIGLDLSIIGKQKKIIKSDSYTDKNIDWIKKQYPGYCFKRDNDGQLFYYIYVIIGKKL